MSSFITQQEATIHVKETSSAGNPKRWQFIEYLPHFATRLSQQTLQRNACFNRASKMTLFARQKKRLASKRQTWRGRFVTILRPQSAFDKITKMPAKTEMERQLSTIGVWACNIIGPHSLKGFKTACVTF